MNLEDPTILSQEKRNFTSLRCISGASLLFSCHDILSLYQTIYIRYTLYIFIYRIYGIQGVQGATSLDPAHHPYAKVKKKKKKKKRSDLDEEEEEEHPYAKVERKRGNSGQEPEVRTARLPYRTALWIQIYIVFCWVAGAAYFLKFPSPAPAPDKFRLQPKRAAPASATLVFGS